MLFRSDVLVLGREVDDLPGEATDLDCNQGRPGLPSITSATTVRRDNARGAAPAELRGLGVRIVSEFGWIIGQVPGA